MRSRICGMKSGPESSGRSAISRCSPVRPAADTALAMDKVSPAGMGTKNPAGMGTKNFVTEILDTYAVLSGGRKQALIDYSSWLAREQQAERRAEG